MGSTVLHVLGEEVASDAPLMAAGLDSLGAAELQASLAQALELDLPATVIYDYPTIDALSAFLRDTLLQLHSLTVPQSCGSNNSGPLVPSGGYKAAALILGSAGVFVFLFYRYLIIACLSHYNIN